MSANRMIGRINGLAADVKSGDALVSNRIIVVVAADAAYTLTVGDIAGGAIQFTGLTAGRNLTVPTAAALDAAFPEVGIGETLQLQISITTAFALTLVTNTGMTLAGKATVPASGSKDLYFTKTAAGAWTARLF